jgi:hypothetical protein
MNAFRPIQANLSAFNPYINDFFSSNRQQTHFSCCFSLLKKKSKLRVFFACMAPAASYKHSKTFPLTFFVFFNSEQVSAFPLHVACRFYYFICVPLLLHRLIWKLYTVYFFVASVIKSYNFILTGARFNFRNI